MPLQRGAFICEYAGEPINAAAARARLAEYDAAGAGHALLVARLVLPSGRAALRLNLDATRSGNVARCVGVLMCVSLHGGRVLLLARLVR